MGSGKNTVYYQNGGGGDAISIYSTGTGAEITLKHTNLTIFNNKATGASFIGIWAESAGAVNVEGNGSNLLKFDRNQSSATDYDSVAIYTNGASISIKNASLEITENSTGTSNSIAFNTYQTSSAVLENVNINIHKNTTGGSHVYGIYVDGTSSFTMKGGGTYSVKNNTAAANFYGIYGAANSKIDISGYDIDMLNNTSRSPTASGYGIAALGTVNITGRANRNIMMLKNNITASVYARGGTVNITNMNVFTEGNNALSVDNNGKISLTNSSLQAKTDGIYTILSEDATGGEVIFTNSSVSHETGYLISASSGGPLKITANNSILNGFAEKDAASTTNITLKNGSNWHAWGNSAVSSVINNDSTLDISSKSDSSAFSTFTTENYTSSNGAMVIRTALAGDASETDRFIIDTNAVTGRTSLNIKDIRGNERHTNLGIKIIETTNGATTNNDSFFLPGGMLDTGAYQYYLRKGDTTGADADSWYLYTKSEWTNTFKTIANSNALAVGMAHTAANTLSKRLGELRDNDKENKFGAWARSYVKSLKVDDTIKTTTLFFGVEGGYDVRLENESENDTYIGVMVNYMQNSNAKTRQTNSFDGKGDGKGYGFGAYATWMTPNGLFVDATIRNLWTSMDMTSYSAIGAPIKFSPDRMATIFSFEVGKQFKFMQDDKSSWILEPKAEILFSASGSKKVRTSLGDEIHYKDTRSLIGKLSLAMGYKTLLKNDMVAEPYVQAALLDEFKGKTDIRYSGVTYKSDLSGASFEIGTGLNLQVNKKSSVYFDFMYESGDIISSVSGNIGYRFTF